MVWFTLIFFLCNSVMPIVNATPEENIKQSTTEIKLLDKQLMDLKEELSALNAEIGQLDNKLKQNREEISKTEDKIKNIELEISDTKKTLETKQVILDKRVRSIYKSKFYRDTILIVLTSKSFSDAVANAKAATKIISLDKKLISDIEEKNEELLTNVSELNSKKDDYKALENSIQSSLETLKSKREAQQLTIEKIKVERQKASSIIKENEEALVAHSISVINSSNPSENSIRNSISNLRLLLPQISTSSVKDAVENAISKGTELLRAMNNNNNNSINFDRGTILAKKTYIMEATAYFDGLITASGLEPVRNPSGLSTVAVDPSVIPLGSKLYIEGYGYAIAADTGSAIKNLKIDLYMNSLAECYSFGRRKVSVSLLAYPNEW